jgi:hypothetical protein
MKIISKGKHIGKEERSSGNPASLKRRLQGVSIETGYSNQNHVLRYFVEKKLNNNKRFVKMRVNRCNIYKKS